MKFSLCTYWHMCISWSDRRISKMMDISCRKNTIKFYKSFGITTFVIAHLVCICALETRHKITLNCVSTARFNNICRLVAEKLSKNWTRFIQLHCIITTFDNHQTYYRLFNAVYLLMVWNGSGWWTETFNSWFDGALE